MSPKTCLECSRPIPWGIECKACEAVTLALGAIDSHWHQSEYQGVISLIREYPSLAAFGADMVASGSSRSAALAGMLTRLSRQSGLPEEKFVEELVRRVNGALAQLERLEEKYGSLARWRELCAQACANFASEMAESRRRAGLDQRNVKTA